MHLELPADASIRLDEHAGASRGGPPVPRRYAEIHDTAARQDGIVKIIIGLVFVVFSLGLAMAAILGIHLLVKQHVLKVWAFVIGVPGIVLTLVGFALITWGAAKLFTGRGDG
ncbi:MAG: hypothetical protein J0M02_15175 [Planctomycetes bacterium]|nr:hypothetical protein [Planctomycetota bacterium]